MVLKYISLIIYRRNQMTADELWKEYIANSEQEDCSYEAWAFGGNPDLLAKLVVMGVKTATASAYPLYELANEPIPQVGGFSVILDAVGDAVCVIKTTRCYVMPFDEVSEEHAYKEGEGDRSLAYWQEVHRAFFSDCLEGKDASFHEKMKVVCEEFELMYRNKAYKY